MKRLFAISGFLLTGFSAWSQPVNDEPCQAIPLDVNQACAPVPANNNGATNSSVGNPSCGGYNGEDVWFVALVPANGAISITSQSGSLSNMSMAVYSAASCAGPFIEEACEDGGNGMPAGVFSGLTPGSYVFIRVWDYYSAGIFGIGVDPLEQGTFSICAQSSSGSISTGGTGNSGSYDCGNTPPAGNTCDDATPICAFDGYCGSTAGYSADYWSSGSNGLGGVLNADGIFCGSIENNSFISFVAGASTVELDVEVSGSVVNCDDGVQFMMFGLNTPGPVCNSMDVIDYGCESPMPPGVNSFTGTGLVPGQEYYLMVDGFAGDICDYQINAISGVLVEMSAGPDQTICLGESVDLTIYGAGTGTITWQGQFLNTTTGETVTATPTSVGTYEYIVNAPTISPLCTGLATDADTVLITVIDATPISVSAGTCTNGETVLTANGATNYTWTPVESLDQTSGSPVTASPVVQTTYTVTGSGPGGCSLTAIIVVEPCDIPCDTPSVVYPPTVCQGATVTPTVDMTGGTFSFNPLPGDGATINAATGQILNPTDGTIYNITYTYVNLCGTPVEVFSTVTGAPFCGVVLCYDGSNIIASGGDGNYTWYETTTTTSSTLITSEAECVSCPGATANYFFGLYTGCSQTTCSTTSTVLTQYATGGSAAPPTSFPLEVTDGSGSVVTYNNLGDITPCATVCTPPNLIVDNQTICEPNSADLNASLNGASDPGNISFYGTLGDANSASNPIGNMVAVSGTYYLRLEDSSDPSCFSVAAVDVTINPDYNLAEDITVCENSSVTYPDGTMATIIASTSHTSNLNTVAGCDSVIVTNVTMNPVYNLTENGTVCPGSDYTYPDGTVSSNILVDESHLSNLTSMNGCDSIITTSITVNSAINITEDFSVCEGEDYTYPDGTLSTNIVVNETHLSNFTTVQGCDSIVTSNITIMPVYNLTENINVCENSSVTYPDGNTATITSSTSYTSNMTTTAGCDSVIVTNVTMDPISASTVDITVCTGASYTYPDGSVSTNIVVDESQVSNLTTVDGCDSIITTNIAVSAQFTSTENFDVCEASDYTYPDGTVSTNILVDESHISTFVSTLGCDSLVTTNLTVSPISNVTENIMACENTTVTFPDGASQLIVSDVSHTSNLTTIVGCDSIIITNVTMQPNYNLAEAVTICENETVNYPDGNSELVTGNTTHTSNLVSVFGCDSIIVTNVTMSPISNAIVDISVCTGATYTYPDGTVAGNITVDESHISNLSSINGCDSIITTNITVSSQFTSTENIDICEGSDYTYPDGTNVTNVIVNASHISTFVSTLGCDSLVTTNLNVNPIYNLNEDITVCENSTVTFPDGNSQVITASITHTSNLTTDSGCDSIIVTNVTMESAFNGNENLTACENSTVTYPDGTTAVITANTVYTSSLLTIAGCDSIIVTTVTMNPNYSITEDETICSGDSFTYPDGTVSNNITTSESHLSTFVSINGCDSTVTTNVSVSPIPSINAGVDQTICEGEGVLLSASGGISYAWDNGVTDGQAFNPLVSGDYTVTGTDGNGCVSTDMVTITVELNPIVDFMGDVLNGCAAHTVNFSDLSSGGANCFWDFGDGNTSSSCGDQSNTYEYAGTYSVSLTVTTANGCESETTYDDLIEVYENPIAAFTMGQSQVSADDMEVDFTNHSINADSYEWIWNDGSPNSFDVDPTHEYSNTGSSGYTVTLFAYNNICVDSTQQFIPFEDVLIFYVPNVFTPDGDDYNEYFKPVFTSGYDPYDFHLMIFNRWGEVIFETYDASKGWNGHYGDGGLVQDGVYVWKLDFRESMSDKRHERMGHVSVLK
jgi:gliding motility-associated-like protein